MNNARSLDIANQKYKVGLFSIGLEAYWDQFAGLRERLECNNNAIHRRLEALGTEVVNAGLVDAPGKAVAAGHVFRQKDIDLLFLHVSTYAVSSTVLPVVRRCKAPVVVLNLSPEAAIDYGRFNELGDRVKRS